MAWASQGGWCDDGSPAFGDAYAPAVPADWAPAPTTVHDALDQLVRDGAGHFRKARDPLLTPGPTIFVRVTGSDSGTNDGSAASPFASLARAMQAIPAMPEWANTNYATVDVGPGTFDFPQDAQLGTWLFVGAVTVTASYTIDATQPANTTSTGSRIVLTTTAAASTIPIGTRIRIPSLGTYNGGDGIVYRSDNSGVGGRLVLWVTLVLR